MPLRFGLLVHGTRPVAVPAWAPIQLKCLQGHKVKIKPRRLKTLKGHVQVRQIHVSVNAYTGCGKKELSPIHFSIYRVF